ncbi:MAG: fatty acid desaturase [Acetobacteraceae bacterium]
MTRTPEAPSPDWVEPLTPVPSPRSVRSRLAAFQVPDRRRSIWQVTSTGALYLALLAVMYAMPWDIAWLGLGLAVPAASMVVRLFIIQHDCGHGSFFRSKRANDILGWCCSLATFTPYANWRYQHAHHHAVWNNLDRRNSGTDIYSGCLTVAEYCALPPFRRLVYRVSMHPLVALLILPPLIFLVLFRWPFDTPCRSNRERLSVWVTNFALLAVYGGLAVILGFWSMLMVHLSVMVIASIVGVWMFSIQHRFEHAMWDRQDSWTPSGAALQGSSHLRLPRILHWFTGNIGFHHLHHLAPRIPNYRLVACQAACEPLLPTSNSLSVWQAMRAYRFTLWDEERKRMVGFRDIDAPCA